MVQPVGFSEPGDEAWGGAPLPSIVKHSNALYDCMFQVCCCAAGHRLRRSIWSWILRCTTNLTSAITAFAVGLLCERREPNCRPKGPRIAQPRASEERAPPWVLNPKGSPLFSLRFGAAQRAKPEGKKRVGGVAFYPGRRPRRPCPGLFSGRPIRGSGGARRFSCRGRILAARRTIGLDRARLGVSGVHSRVSDPAPFRRVVGHKSPCVS
jgi:hypothetical protein